MDAARRKIATPGPETLPFKYNYEGRSELEFLARLLLDMASTGAEHPAVGGAAPTPQVSSPAAATPVAAETPAAAEAPSEAAAAEGAEASTSSAASVESPAEPEAEAPSPAPPAPASSPVGSLGVPDVPAWTEAEPFNVCEARDMVALLSLLVGEAMVEAEEITSGEQHLMQFVRRMRSRPREVAAQFTVPIVRASNQLGFLWTRRGEPAKALGFLNAGLKAYTELKDAPALASAKNATPAVLASLSVAEDLEDAHTHTCFYLAQTYAATDPPQKDLSAKYQTPRCDIYNYLYIYIYI